VAEDIDALIVPCPGQTCRPPFAVPARMVSGRAIAATPGENLAARPLTDLAERGWPGVRELQLPCDCAFRMRFSTTTLVPRQPLLPTLALAVLTPVDKFGQSHKNLCRGTGWGRRGNAGSMNYPERREHGEAQLRREFAKREGAKPSSELTACQCARSAIRDDCKLRRRVS
jgi:hypothetical protein